MGRIEKTVFVSYRRTDELWGLAIFQDLTQHGYDVFIDYDGIASGNFAGLGLHFDRDLFFKALWGSRCARQNCTAARPRPSFTTCLAFVKLLARGCRVWWAGRCIMSPSSYSLVLKASLLDLEEIKADVPSADLTVI